MPRPIKWVSNSLSQARHNKSLDASGGGVFLNLIRPAKVDLIRAAASTQPLCRYCFVRDKSMEGGNTQSTQLIRRVESAPSGLKPYRFTLRDDNEQHYHRRMRVIESPVYIALAWRANAKSQVHSLGLFRLDLRGLLSAGYIRSDGPQPDDEVRVRFHRANNGTIYLQTKQGAPALAVAPAPV
jgi:hypothetical protein